MSFIIKVFEFFFLQFLIINFFIFIFLSLLSIGGLHLAIEEQDPLPNDDVNDDTPQPVNSEFITINVASNEHDEKIKTQIPNG